MAGWDDDPVVASAAVGAALPKAPPAAKSPWDEDPVVTLGQPAAAPRAASGVAESFQAGLQGSVIGMGWRRKVPDLVMNPETSAWWERAIAGVTQVAADLPIMIPSGVAGGAAGTAAAGPVGGILGGGAAMFGVVGGIRESLMQAYKSGEITTSADWFNAIREIAMATVKESAVGAVTMGTGALARGAVGVAMGAGKEAATAIGLGTATAATRAGARAGSVADVAGQIAGMVTMPAALHGKLPNMQEFGDAAVVIFTLNRGLKGAHVLADRAGLLRTTQKVTDTYVKTGKTPAEQVQDAQADARVAEDLTNTRAAEDVKTSAAEEAWKPLDPVRIQESLFIDTGRLEALDRKAEGVPETKVTSPDGTPLTIPARPKEFLTDAERIERDALKARVAELEAKLDTARSHENSAQKVYDDVLGQVRAADEARQASGLTPLGDDHALAVAALVKARVRTRAARLGVLPEEIYRERPLQIRDETAAEVAAAEAEIPPEAPRFVPPEVDMFGDPVPTTNAPRFGVEGMATVETPIDGLVLSKEVPQFKNAANAEGVVVPLGGKFDRTGVGPIQVWERLDGTREIISGRHRFDLARRSGETTIPAQIHREADGFTARMAATLDAELNIREEQGSVADYAQYFKDSGKTREAANELGLLARAKGRAGFAIAENGSPDLLAAHRAGLLSDDAALSIAQAAPGIARLQALGIQMVNEGKSILYAVNTMKAVEVMAAEHQAAGAQGDIFGFDDSAMQEAAAMGKKASSAQRALSEQIAAVSGASKRPEIARRLGVNVADPEGIQKRIVELRQEQYQWDNWPLYPDLVAKLRELNQEAFELKPETPAELRARDEEAAAAAKRKLAEEAAADRAKAGKKVTVDQVDMFNEQGTLFQDKPDWYYSELSRFIEAAPMKQGTAKAWKDLITSRIGKGVKQAEIEATGLTDWLDAQPGKVTKEQINAFMVEGGVKITETVAGDSGVSPKAARTLVDHLVEIMPGMPRSEHEGLVAEAARGDADAIGHLESIIAPERYNELLAPFHATTATKFSQYQEPGAVPGSYREIVLTLPESGKRVMPSFEEWHAKTHTMPLAEVRAKPRLMEIALRQYERDKTAFERNPDAFTSTHFPEAGDYLAHMRINDRVTADGKKVLFVEEIQSDRAQKGRKEGFGGEKQWPVEFSNGDVGWFKTEAEARRAGNERDGTVGQPTLIGGVPRAPFVEKTEAWTALVLKRLLRYAAEGGYDSIAWTRGEQQVERYSNALRKAVDVIEWKKTPEGVHLVGWKGKGPTDLSPEDRAAYREEVRTVERLRDTGGQLSHHAAEAALLRIRTAYNVNSFGELIGSSSKVVDTTEKENALSDSIGKAMADRIRNDPGQSETIEGDAITVSDTGMAGYYDRIVPSVMKDVVKKLEGGQVESTPLLNLHRVQRVYGKDGGWLVQKLESNQPDILIGKYQSKDAANAEADRLNAESKQPAIQITPAMREKIIGGQALFQEHRGSYQVAENLITIMQGADKSTVVHELTHSWLEEMKADAMRPDAPEQIKADWEILRRELAIGEDGNISRASHEQFARSGERYLGEGEAPSIELRGVFERFRAWLLEIYRDLRNLNVTINPELRGVLDRMLATDAEIEAARELGVPRPYVPEAKAQLAEKIVPGFKDEQLAIEPFAEELLAGPGSGLTNDSRVNAQYINGPMDLKLTIQQIANRDQVNIQEKRGGTDGVRSWEQANAEADKLVEDTLGGKMVDTDPTNAVPHDIRQRAAFKVMVSVAKYSLQLRDQVLAKGDNASVQDQFDYLASIVRMRMAHAEYLGLRAASARAMNQVRDMTPESGVVDKMVELTSRREDGTLFQDGKTEAEQAAELKAKLEAIMLAHFGGKSALDIAKLQKDIKSLKGQLTLAKEVTDATGWEMVIEGWRSGLLSGPQTPITNLLGTSAFEFMRPPIDALASIIGMARGASPGMGESDRASMSESVARLLGMLGGVKEGLTVGYHALKADEVTGKTESYREAIPGRAGYWIRLPYRLMSAGDAITTTMYKRGELATLAIRQAFDEGLNPSSREFAERVQALKDSPTPEMEKIATDAAARFTFNTPGGEKMMATQAFVKKWHLEWMVPFIRTPLNIAEEMLRMSPFAPTMNAWRADIAKGGVARDRAVAELVVGSGIMALTAAYAFSGQISGSGSPEPGKNRGKAGVWQANSLLIGDKWYEYGRIQPVGTLMALAADMAMAWDHMNDEERDKIPKILAMAFSNAITNQTFLQGITNVVHMMSEPDRYGSRFFQGLAGSMVPNVIGQPTTMADPYVRQVNNMMEAVLARLPGFRQDLAPKQDWLGEKVETKERLGLILPVREQKVSDDKVRLEAARLDISMADAPKKTHIGKGTGKLGDVELTPEERTKFAQVGGEFAHKILANIVAAPGYDAIPDLVKKQIFAKVLTASHRVAAVAAMPMDKRMAYISSISERVRAELQPEEQP